MMRLKDFPLKSKLVICIVVSVFLILAISTAVIINTVTSQEEKLAYQKSTEMSRNYANQFDSDLKADRAIAETLANTMENYEAFNRSEVINILKNNLKKNPNLIGVYVGYEPNAFDGRDAEYVNSPGHDTTGRFVPYCNRIKGNPTVIPLKNYNLSDYYQLPKARGTSILTEPYFYENTFMVSLVSPIFKNDKFTGIAGVDVPLQYVDEKVSKIRAFETGYAFMVSNTGILLSHPTRKDWIGKKSLYDLNSKEIDSVAKNIENGIGGYIDTKDPTTGKNVIMFYEPARTGNFAFVLVIPKEEMLAGVTDLRNKLIIISAISILFMACLAYLIARSITKPINEIVEDFKSIAQDAVNGKLDVRADTDVEIDFKEIPVGLNEILKAVIVPIKETIRVTNALAEGKLKERVSVEMQGEFRELGETLDKFSEALNQIIDDSNTVLTAFQQNDFKRKIQVQGNGDFKLLTDGIEETRQALDMVTAQRLEAENNLRNYAMKLEHSNQLNEELERVIRNSPVIVFLWEYMPTWPVDFVSENISQLGYKVEDFTSKKLRYIDIIHPEDLDKIQKELFKRVESGCNEYNAEYRILTKSGEIRWVDERTVIQKCTNEQIRLQGIILDITERKKAEEALLRMEEIRKKEIHHRIKNNLQVISTLLYLESGNFTDENVTEAFRNSQHRVKSMALVHEKLYQSEDMVSVDFADYIKNLADYLLRSYSLGDKKVSLKLDVEKIFLGMDTAVPLGIIINELISNSLKHAFTKGVEGEIYIKLQTSEEYTAWQGENSRKVENKISGNSNSKTSSKRAAESKKDKLILIVRDNGVGFPEKLDFRNTTSLGLQLVTTLVDQIEGDIELDTTAGTEFKISFFRG
jgi:PAS domain S-box